MHIVQLNASLPSSPKGGGGSTKINFLTFSSSNLDLFWYFGKHSAGALKA